MSSAISYPYYQSQKNVPGGWLSLNENTEIDPQFLPPGAIETYKGEFANEAALIAAYPSGSLADYAYVTDTLSFWYWNKSTSPAKWVNQEITDTAFTALSAAEKAAVPYIIVP